MVTMTTPVCEKHWWEEGAGFFGRGYMQGDDSVEGYLEQPMTLTERTTQEVNGIINLLQLQRLQRVLDCPCGYGRHSINLAHRGLEVIGADINSEELAVACQCISNLPNVQFIKNDMRYLYFHDYFDAVINMFYSFGFFDTDEENMQVLRNFYTALKPGGKFLMHTDVNIPRIISVSIRALNVVSCVKAKFWRLSMSMIRSRSALMGHGHSFILMGAQKS